MATHIRLTPTHIIVTVPARVAGAPPKVETQKLQRIGPMIFPLQSVMMMPNAAFTAAPMVEVAHAGNMQMSWICAERWEDLLQALRDAVSGELIEPLLRHPAIEEAAKAASPDYAEAQQRRTQAERQKFPMPAKVGELLAASAPADVQEDAEQPADEKPSSDEILREYGMAPTVPKADGVTLPLPASSRELQPGDIRIRHLTATGIFTVEFAESVDGEIVWTRQTVPSKLMNPYPNFAAAAQAIRIAGLAHRLIDQDDQAT